MTGVEAMRPRSRMSTIGRRVGIASFSLLVGGSTAIWTVQILMQVWGRPLRAATTDCRTSLYGLVVAVERAREAAAREPAGERAALARFRAQLAPEWDQRGAIGLTCEADAEAHKALAEVDRFRYAEEHSVRYSAVDLAKRRRNVRQLEQRLGLGKSERTVGAVRE